MNNAGNDSSSGRVLSDEEIATRLTRFSRAALEQEEVATVNQAASSAASRETPGAIAAPPRDDDLFAALTRYEDLPEQWRGKYLWQWDERTRVLPVDIAISALFTIGNRKIERRAMQRESITILSREFDMFYTGIELRQDDELIWMQLLHMARGYERPLGSAICFTPSRFLAAIGKNRGSQNYIHLKESMARLQATTVELYSKQHKSTKTFRLVSYFEYQDERFNTLPAWKVVLDPRIFFMLDGKYHAQMNFACRKKLGSGLTSKLHSYYACHKKPMDRSISDLFSLCYGKDEQIKILFYRQRRIKRTVANESKATTYLSSLKYDFKRYLIEALEMLTSTEVNFLSSYKIYNDGSVAMVHVDRSAQD